MAKTLDFNTRKKSYMKIVLSDPDKTTVNVGTPTKSLLTELALVMADKASGGVPNEERMSNLYEFCARLMSRNRENKVITKDLIESCLDFDDLIYFMDCYTDFINDSVPKN